MATSHERIPVQATFVRFRSLQYEVESDWRSRSSTLWATNPQWRFLLTNQGCQDFLYSPLHGHLWPRLRYRTTFWLSALWTSLRAPIISAQNVSVRWLLFFEQDLSQPVRGLVRPKLTVVPVLVCLLRPCRSAPNQHVKTLTITLACLSRTSFRFHLGISLLPKNDFHASSCLLRKTPLLDRMTGNKETLLPLVMDAIFFQP